MRVETDSAAAGEQRLLLHGVSWARYLALRELLEDQAGLRVTYLKGAMEIMSPSREHERRKKLIARLVEAFAGERHIALNGYGSATFRKQAKERGAEPDECYVIGDASTDIPQIAIEVVITSGGVDKLAVYGGLGVPEVWFFSKNRFFVYLLGDDGYTLAQRSALMPELDFDLLATFIERTDQTAAVAAFRKQLQQQSDQLS